MKMQQLVFVNQIRLNKKDIIKDVGHDFISNFSEWLSWILAINSIK